MGRFENNADYSLAWPSSILRAELEALIQKASRIVNQQDWRNEAETLLRQAFISETPLQEFDSETTGASQPWTFDEPF
jgi:hypothetical protein